jgi:hypothetical protein
MKTKPIAQGAGITVLCLTTMIGASALTGCQSTPVRELAAHETVTYKPDGKSRERVSRRSLYYYSGPSSKSPQSEAQPAAEQDSTTVYSSVSSAPAPVGDRVIIAPGYRRTTTIYGPGQFNAVARERNW